MSDLFAKLTPAQENLLRVIWGPMQQGGRWPNWNYVQATCRRSDIDAEATIRSLPTIGSTDLLGRRYSVAWFDDRNLAPSGTVRLTLAAGLHLPEYRSAAEWVIEGLQELVVRFNLNEPHPYEVKDVVVTGLDLANLNHHFTKEFVTAFPELLRYEPFNFTSNLAYFTGGKDWDMTLGRDLLKFEGVKTLEEYVRRATDLIAEEVREARARHTFMSDGPIQISTSPEPRNPVQRGVTVAGFQAHMVTALIASPGDTNAERDLVEQVVLEVNASRMRSEGRGLLPLRWERDVVTRIGASPQEIVNEVADTADIVVALFRARMGTPTSEHPSGTVEEIERAAERGVHVHIFFLDYGVKLSEIDPVQHAALKEWQKKLQPRGLYDVVSDVAELQSKLRRYLDADLTRLAVMRPTVEPEASRKITWRASMSPKSRGQYELHVVPDGVAEDVEVKLAPSSRADADENIPFLLLAGRKHAGADRLPPGQPMILHVMASGAAARNFNVEISWRDGELEYSDSLSVTY